jgi:ABC-2 type transport system permease protein
MNARIARRLAAIMVKESLQILRDPSSILIGFILPGFLTLLAGYSTNLDLTNLPVGLVLEDTSPEARSLAAAFSASPAFDSIRPRPPGVRGRLTRAVCADCVSPHTFAGNLPGPTQRALQVLADARAQHATFLQNYAQGCAVWMEIRRKITARPSPGRELVPRTCSTRSFEPQRLHPGHGHQPTLSLAPDGPWEARNGTGP